MLQNDDAIVDNSSEVTTANLEGQEISLTLRQKLVQGIKNLFLPLQVRNFFLLFSGQLTSIFGDAFYSVALPWFILTNGGSALTLGTLLAAYGIARTGTSLIGGWLSDKFTPRWIMLVADILRALLVAGLAIMAVGGHLTLWLLYAISVPLGALSGVFLPAYYAMTPEVLSDDKLQAGNALSSSSIQIAELLGPSVAGIVVSVARSGVGFMIDAFSFVVSIATLAAMRETKKTLSPSTNVNSAGSIAASEIESSSGISTVMEETPSAPNSSLEEISTTINHPQTIWGLLRQSQLLQVSLTITIVANLMLGGAIEVALPKLILGSLGGGATAYGLLLALFSAGAIIGSLSSGIFGKLPRRGLIALATGLVQAGAYTLVPITGQFIGAAIFLIIAGVANGANNVFYGTILQQKLPRHLFGRVMGIMTFCSLGLYPLSAILAGFVTQQFGPTLMFIFLGITLTAAFGYGFLRPEFRNL